MLIVEDVKTGWVEGEAPVQEVVITHGYHRSRARNWRLPGVVVDEVAHDGDSS